MHLREQLSNFEPLQITVVVGHKAAGQGDVEHPSAVRRIVRPNRKLRPAEVGELVARYRDGADIRGLGRAFGVHEQTVRAHLLKAGVALRPTRVLTDVQLAEAAELYRAGWSTMRLGERYGVGATTVGVNLKRLGVKMRPRGWEPGGSDRSA